MLFSLNNWFKKWLICLRGYKNTKKFGETVFFSVFLGHYGFFLIKTSIFVGEKQALRWQRDSRESCITCWRCWRDILVTRRTASTRVPITWAVPRKHQQICCHCSRGGAPHRAHLLQRHPQAPMQHRRLAVRSHKSLVKFHHGLFWRASHEWCEALQNR